MNKEEITKRRWRVRRRMAIAAFLYLVLIVPTLLFVPEKKLDVLSNVATVVIGAMATIIMVYIGFATADDKWQKENDYQRGIDQ